MRADLLEKLVAARRDKRAVALVTSLNDGLQALVHEETSEGSLGLDEATLERCRAMLTRDESGIVELGEQEIFVQSHAPPLRLLIVGAVHIAQHLAPLARAVGYEVTIIDPRGAFASPERFPDIALRTDWPDEALAVLHPDRRTALVALTHDPKLDDPALVAALASPAFYVGALGSRKTHAARLERLGAHGLDDAALTRIHGPIGLAIGAKSPAEIAISILAQMTAVLRGAA